MKEEHAQQYGAHGADACPYGIGCDEGRHADGLEEQIHAQSAKHDEKAYPHPVVQADGRFGLAQTEGESALA